LVTLPDQAHLWAIVHMNLLYSLLLCVKFERSIIQDCKKYVRKCEITNLVTQAHHVHFVAVRCTKWVWSARKTKNLGGHVTCPRQLFEKFLRGHVRTVPVNMSVKYEVRSFNCFGAISI